MVKFFGDNKTFTATAECSVEASSQTVPKMQLGFSMLDGKTRTDLDLLKMMGAMGSQLPPNALEQVKQMGMDKMAAITLPDKKTILIVYPSLQAYVEQAMNDRSSIQDSDLKIETTSLGKETVKGHACDKTKIIITDKDGNKHEGTAWKAADMKNFPIQLQMTEKQGVVTMVFLDVKFDKPDAKLFDPPAGYTKYASQQELMQAVMMKRMGGMGGPPK